MATTILNSSPHQYETDCKHIHDSLTTLNYDQTLRRLATRTQHERRQVRETYKRMYGVELTTHLQDMTRLSTTHYSSAAAAGVEILSMWMFDPHQRDAIVLREAIQKAAQRGGCKSYMTMVEIFVGRKSSHVVLIQQAYHALFNRRLSQDLLQIEPSDHPFQRILVALASSHKAHQVYTSQHTAKCDAKRLYETGEAKSRGCIDEAVVLEILCKRSIPQLEHTFSCYKHIYGHAYTKSLGKENSREFEDAFKLVVKCMCNPAKYYAKVLKGSAEDTKEMTRVIVSRAEIDMDEIQTIFKLKNNGIELRDAIIQNTVAIGDSNHFYRDFLLAMLTKTKTSFKKDFTVISS